MNVTKVTPGALLALTSWIVAIAAAWLAVGTQFSFQTLLIAATGFLYLVFPPVGGFPRIVLGLMVLLLLLASLTFLPATWMGAAFRAPFQAEGIDLPGTLSPQPWLSLDDLTLLLVTLMWTRICLEGNFSVKQREFLLASYVVALGLVAAVKNFESILLAHKIPGFLQHLGQFANRNQSSDLLVMGGVFSFGRALSDLAKRKFTGGWWVFLTMLFLVAVIQYASRASLALFLLGLLLLGVFMQERRQQGSIYGAVLSLVAVVGVFIVVFKGSELVLKLQFWTHGHDGRFTIYEDAARMITLAPWCGVGVGNFEGVFNTIRLHSLPSLSRNLHPESDWFWAACELGIPGVILVALLLVAVYRTYFVRSFSPDLRKPCVIVALLFLIHSLFDVPGHRMGTTWSCIYLVSLGALGVSSPSDIKIPSPFLRAAGIFLLLLAILRIQSTGPHPWMPTRGSLTLVEAPRFERRPSPEQKELLDNAVRWVPLDWRFYYKRGVVCLQIPDLSGEATTDFNRALFLEPNSIELPGDIGTACLETDRPEALTAWKELLKRAGARREEMFQNLFYNFGSDEKARLEIADLAGNDFNLQAIAAYECQDSPQFNWFLQNLLDADPLLEGISPYNLRFLFDRWAALGDTAAFIQEWPLHPEWRIPGWRGYVQGLAKVGRYRDAIAITMEMMPGTSLPAPVSHQSVDEATHNFLISPGDPYAGMMLYSALMNSGAKDQALATLQQVSKIPKRPALVQILLARHLLDENQDQAAWQALKPILNDD